MKKLLHHKGTLLMITGLLLVLSALVLSCYYALVEKKANRDVDDTLKALELILADMDIPYRPVSPVFPADPAPETTVPALITSAVSPPVPPEDTADAPVTGAIPAQTTAPEPENVPGPQMIPDYLLNPRMEMPVIRSGGTDFIGILEIPSLSLILPIASDWSEQKLKISPCRYWGSAYLDNMVISGHNYANHFGRLSSLRGGEAVIFTDMSGNVFRYKVIGTEVLYPSDSAGMVNGEGFDLTLFTCTFGGRTRFTVRCVRILDNG